MLTMHVEVYTFIAVKICIHTFTLKIKAEIIKSKLRLNKAIKYITFYCLKIFIGEIIIWLLYNPSSICICFDHSVFRQYRKFLWSFLWPTLISNMFELTMIIYAFQSSYKSILISLENFSFTQQAWLTFSCICKACALISSEPHSSSR